jgi:hypothetical protein
MLIKNLSKWTDKTKEELQKINKNTKLLYNKNKINRDLNMVAHRETNIINRIKNKMMNSNMTKKIRNMRRMINNRNRRKQTTRMIRIIKMIIRTTKLWNKSKRMIKRILNRSRSSLMGNAVVILIQTQISISLKM